MIGARVFGFAECDPGEVDPNYRMAHLMVDQVNAQRATAAKEPITPTMREIIRDGRALVYDVQNAFTGSAHDVGVLVLKGLMVKAGWYAPRQSFEGVSRYSLTDAGRSEQERIRKEDLAKIGVTEVETHNP